MRNLPRYLYNVAVGSADMACDKASMPAIRISFSISIQYVFFLMCVNELNFSLSIRHQSQVILLLESLLPDYSLLPKFPHGTIPKKRLHE